ncbi:hypothetical protein BaRGS_00021820 [Batillaria attramentaria]|uniref:Uncharacterized protein n=1 Tax=Batillaria attramentaria TaxID=370345 RepID=A0ABD0KIJ5_9CAEN
MKKGANVSEADGYWSGSKLLNPHKRTHTSCSVQLSFVACRRMVERPTRDEGGGCGIQATHEPTKQNSGCRVFNFTWQNVSTHLILRRHVIYNTKSNVNHKKGNSWSMRCFARQYLVKNEDNVENDANGIVPKSEMGN